MIYIIFSTEIYILYFVVFYLFVLFCYHIFLRLARKEEHFLGNTFFLIHLIQSISGVSVHPGAAAVPSQQEGFVLLSLPRPAADPEEVGPEEALPRSHRLAGGTHHWHG